MIMDALDRHAPNTESMLEVGCGTGFVLQGLHERHPGLRLVGGELLVEGLRIARERVPAAELLQLDARHIPFDGAFDAVGAFDVVEHIDEDEEVLAQLHRALRPGGIVLLTVPQHRWLWSAADDYARHRRRYTRRELVSKLRAAGFELCQVTSFVTLLLPAMAAFRILQSRRKTFEPGEDLRVSVNVRSPLESIMLVEEVLIRHGVSLPIGGSLLAVARRPH
jgi:SAM-dependent methyltransferase